MKSRENLRIRKSTLTPLSCGGPWAHFRSLFGLDFAVGELACDELFMKATKPRCLGADRYIKYYKIYLSAWPTCLAARVAFRCRVLIQETDKRGHDVQTRT